MYKKCDGLICKFPINSRTNVVIYFIFKYQVSFWPIGLVPTKGNDHKVQKICKYNEIRIGWFYIRLYDYIDQIISLE